MTRHPASGAAHVLGTILLGIGVLFLWAFGMAAFAFWWGSADGIGVLMLGLLVVAGVGGWLYKRYLDRQDRA